MVAGGRIKKDAQIEQQEEEKADDIVQEQESTEGEGDSSEGVYVVEQGDTLAIISKKATEMFRM